MMRCAFCSIAAAVYIPGNVRFGHNGICLNGIHSGLLQGAVHSTAPDQPRDLSCLRLS